MEERERGREVGNKREERGCSGDGLSSFKVGTGASRENMICAGFEFDTTILDTNIKT